MFDLRYHLASLAAVFLALAVGILLGVAISGKVSTAEESLNAQVIAGLKKDLEQERSRAAGARRRGQATAELVERAYPVLIDRRLEDKDFAVLFLGPVDGDVRSAVEKTLSDAGSGRLVRMIALDFPLEPRGLDEFLAAREALAVYTGEGDFGELGRALGRELVEGGETPLWSALSSELVEERSGAASPPVDGVIVVRSWAAAPADDVQQAERARATGTLIDGLLEGLEESGFPVVGVETSTSDDSAIDLYRERGISSVDDIDTLPGRLALALLLAGGEPGHYGLKESASDGVTPPIEALPREASAG